MNKLLDFLRRRHRPDVEALSARLDVRLPARAAAALDAHLAVCVVCRARYDGLAAARDALRRMPLAPAPRSFGITQGDLARATTARPAPRFGTALKFAGAAAVIVLMVAAGVQLVNNAGSSDDASRIAALSSAPEKSMETAASEAARPSSATEAPAAALAPAPDSTPPIGGIAADSGAPPEGVPTDAAAFNREGTPAVPAASDAATRSGGEAALTPASVSSAEPADGDGNETRTRIVWVIVAVAIAAVPLAVVAWRVSRRSRAP